MLNLATNTPTPNPLLFINNADISAVQSGSSLFWQDQPLWPTKNISFVKRDDRRRRNFIRALTAPAANSATFNIGQQLLYCSEHRPCRSPLCNYCRTKFQDHYQRIVLNTFRQYHFNDIFFLTVLDDLTYDPINHIQGWKDRFKDRLKENLGKIFGDEVQMFGALEVDVKDTTSLQPNDKAYQLLLQYGMTPQHPIAYMPHFHGIVAAKGATASKLRKRLKDNYTKSHQISVSRLHIKKSKEANLARMARYMFKFRYQFSDNIMRAKPSYGTRFDDDTMRTFAQVVHDMKGSRGLTGCTVKYNLSAKG